MNELCKAYMNSVGGQIPINSWIPDQVEDDAEVSGMNLLLVIPAEAGIQEVMDPRSGRA